MSNVLCKIAMLFIVGAFPVGALAHDPHTHQANSLVDAKSKNGLCCDGKDYVVPNDWRGSPETGYRVQIGTLWYDVPKDAMVHNMRNPDMEAKVWLVSGEGEVWIRCFMPGTEV